jgi:hypothetical protein
MPNTIDENGLTLKTRAEIISEILNGGDGFPGLYAIYGADINVDPNSPDGQLVNLIAQLAVDNQELLQLIYDSFDPDQAAGINLDLRCAINGVTRQGATYSTAAVSVIVDRALTLDGLDTEPNNPFTVADGAGNQFVLIAAHTFSGAGVTPLLFRAAELGPIVVLANTIQRVISVTLGVTGCINTAPGTTGAAEESDYTLRVRRSNSTALGSKGFLAGLYAALGQISGVTSVSIQEDIPNHTIWCVVAGGDDADIADAIYIKRSFGVAMLGTEIVEITQVDGSAFFVKFDRPTLQDVWISFDAVAAYGFIDTIYIRTQLLAALAFNIGAAADASSIVALVKEIAPNASITNCQVSDDNVTYVDLLSPSAFNYQFEAASARILINGVAGT